MAKSYQIVKTDGNGHRRVVATANSADEAFRLRQIEKSGDRQGSSNSYTVRER
jgi:hypothetical protein